MKTLIAILILSFSSAAFADLTQAQYNEWKQQLLSLICQRAMNRAGIQKRIDFEKAGGDPHATVPGPNTLLINSLQAQLDDGQKEFDQLKTYYPMWFKKDFEMKDCEKAVR